MDFSQVNLFGKKSFSDLLKEIHSNQKDKAILYYNKTLVKYRQNSP